MTLQSVDKVVVRARERVLDLRARAAERRRVGWELSDIMTPRQFEALSDEIQRMADEIERLRTAIDASVLALRRDNEKEFVARALEQLREPIDIQA